MDYFGCLATATVFFSISRIQEHKIRVNKIQVSLFSFFSESERYRKIAWEDIRVGDIVHLSNNETVPADILLLRSSNPHGVSI